MWYVFRTRVLTKRFATARDAILTPGSLSINLFLFTLAVSVMLAGGAPPAVAQNLSTSPFIFDVRRSLPLEPDEPVFHDFYINAGPESGLRKGAFVNVVRQVPVHDPIQNKQQATLNITVGKLQIIHVERNIAVGRMHSELGDEERPTLEFEAIMIGDRVDLSSISATSPGKKKSARLKAALKLEATVTPAGSPGLSSMSASGLESTESASEAPSNSSVGDSIPAAPAAKTAIEESEAVPPTETTTQAPEVAPMRLPAQTRAPGQPRLRPQPTFSPVGNQSINSSAGSSAGSSADTSADAIDDSQFGDSREESSDSEFAAPPSPPSKNPFSRPRAADIVRAGEPEAPSVKRASKLIIADTMTGSMTGTVTGSMAGIESDEGEFSRDLHEINDDYF